MFVPAEGEFTSIGGLGLGTMSTEPAREELAVEPAPPADIVPPAPSFDLPGALLAAPMDNEGGGGSFVVADSAGEAIALALALPLPLPWT